jgi:hypothetical protein
VPSLSYTILHDDMAKLSIDTCAKTAGGNGSLLQVARSKDSQYKTLTRKAVQIYIN